MNEALEALKLVALELSPEFEAFKILASPEALKLAKPVASELHASQPKLVRTTPGVHGQHTHDTHQSAHKLGGRIYRT